MEIIREKLETSVNQSTSELIWDALARVYTPTIHKVGVDLRTEIGLPETDSHTVYKGDIFFTDPGQLIYYRANGNGRLEVGTIMMSEEGRQSYSGFKEIVRDIALEGKSKKTDWSLVDMEDPRFRLLRQDCKKMDVDMNEMDAALLLSDDRMRSLLQKISEKSPCFQEDIVDSPEDYEVLEIINSLESMGLISKEFYIFCKTSGQQISKVNSLAAIEDAKSHGFRCFACGNLLSEERISPLIHCSPLGQKFARPNYWLALHLMSVLGDFELLDGDILYSTENNNRVFNIFLNYYHKTLMFEVRDEPMRLEEVFLFLTRIKYYQPFRVILLSSHPVSLEVKMYLASQNDCPLTVVEDLDGLEKHIDSNLKFIRQEYIRSVISDFNDETLLPISRIFSEKFFGVEARRVEKPAPEAGVVQPATMEAPEEEYGRIEDFTEVLPSDKMEFIEEEEETAPEMMETTEIAPQPTREMEIPGEEMPPDAEAISEMLEEDLSSEDLPDSPVEVEMPPEDAEDVLEKLEEQMDEYVDEEFRMEFAEALPEEILPTDEIPMAVDTTEEKLEKAAAFILDFSNGEGIPGNVTRIESELSTVNEIGLYSGLLADADGLVITSNLGVSLDSEKMAAYSTTICQAIQRLLEESGIEPATSIHLEGKIGRLKIFPGKGLYLVAHEEKKSGELDEEGPGLPGETSLREAIMKKVMDDLTKTEGIMGNLIAGSDGLVIESNLPEDVDPDGLGYLSSQAFFENSRFLDRLDLGPIRQILIKSGRYTYNLIPIESEAIFTTCLDPSVPREVWQSKLPQAAQMLTSVLT